LSLPFPCAGALGRERELDSSGEYCHQTLSSRGISLEQRMRAGMDDSFMCMNAVFGLVGGGFLPGSEGEVDGFVEGGV
jgi:hypothetical protein